MKHNSRPFELKSIKRVTSILLFTSAIIVTGSAITARVAYMQKSRSTVPVATLTVTNTGDVSGGLREAITTAETTTAADTIVFNIPPTDPRHFYYQNNNVAGTVSTNLIAVTAAADDTTIANIDPDWPHSWYSISSNGSRYLMTTEITIDGFTQPGTVPNTNASGGLNSVLRIEITNGSLPCSRIFTAFASPHVFRGLVLNRCTDGSALDIDFNSNGTRADGNYIGTDPSGTVALGNDNGIAMQQSNSISVGGLQPFQRNLISANFRGIVIASGTASGANISNVAVIGNLIGTKRDGVGALGNGSSPTQPTFPEDAISIQSINGTATNHLIQDNVIAYSTRHGIALFGGGVGSGQTIVRNRITRNSIHSNGALGIELNGGPQGADSVTPNDPCDADSGPNGLQNYPRIKDASFSGGSISIAGTLDGVSTATHTIEFYASDAGDPRGFGEGKTYLGSTTVTDGDGDCLGSFDVTLPLPATAGTVITATTTDNVGNTSEFSAVYLARPRGVSCAMRPAGQISWFRAEGNRNDSEGENYGEFSYDSANRTADYISGAVGQAFNFDSTKTLQIPDTASLDFTNAFTMEMWVSPREAGLPSGQTFFISKGDFVSINTQSYGIMFTPDRKIVNRVGNGTALDQLVGTTAIPLDAFTHIATTYDGSTLRVYVNGVLDGSQSTSIGTLLNSSGLLYIGGADINNAPFRTKVSIDEPSLYSRALSDAEVFAIFNAGSAGKCFSRMCSPLSVTTPGNMDGRVGTPYSRTLQVSGGAAPYTFQLANGPSLPAGLTLNSA
ncbi:MAG: LamG-like jellyroll fold domain-containing protein, partial [Acidobacteriota bacterium]